MPSRYHDTTYMTLSIGAEAAVILSLRPGCDFDTRRTGSGLTSNDERELSNGFAAGSCQHQP